MYGEYDEGLGTSPLPMSFLQRDGATFINDEDPSYVTNKTKSTIFPQRLDLSTYCSVYKTPTKSTKSEKKYNKKKPSPIKPHHDSAITSSKETIDLGSFRKGFDDEVNDFINNSMKVMSRSSSVTSDRATSVSSSGSSLQQRSLSIQLERAMHLVNGLDNQRHLQNYEDVISNSDWHLTSSDDDTRPPSSQASLAYDSVEHIRRQTSDVITRVASDVPIRSHRNAATSTEGFLSDSFLADFYRNRGSDHDRTLVQSEEDQRTIVDEVFEDFRRRSEAVETPILRSARDVSCGSGPEIIEAARNAPVTRMADREPSNIHHSLSMLTVNPQKFEQLAENAHLNRSLPNLERFVIRPSNRDIFNTPLDIDAICGKGVRRNQKSAERIFGGSEVAKSIHGEAKTVSTTSSNSQKLSGQSQMSRRPTTSSSAKVREPSRTRTIKPPYCSVAPADNVSHSVSAVSQNLLGTVKSLYPDWMPMVRRILDTQGIDVALAFREELRKQQLALELKFSRNQRTSEEHDDHRTKLCVLFRILEKLDELRSRGGQYSRVQEIKLIHAALLTA